MIQNVAATGSRLFVFASDLSTSGRSSIASWDGAAWQSLLDGTYLPVSSLAVSAPMCSPANPLFFYVGGYFTQLGGVAANFVTGNGQPLASGLNDSVAFQGLAADEWNLCTIGRFTTAGAKSSYHFAIWHQPFAGNCK